MKRIVIILLFIFFTQAVYAENCKYEFSINRGKIYTLERIDEFIKKEIRPEFSTKDRILTIFIRKKCGDKNETISLGMNLRNFYIININGVDLPKIIVDYDNRLALDIDLATFKKIISDTVKHDYSLFSYCKGKEKWECKENMNYSQRKELMLQQRILKMYAFVFTESARFESALEAVKNFIAKDNCTIDWHGFDYAVHNWKNISTYVLKKKIIEKSQLIGGKYKQLISPILKKQEAAFEKALERNEKSLSFPFFEYRYECK